MRQVCGARSSPFIPTVVALAMSLCGPRSNAQPTWILEHPTRSPEARYGAASAFDPVRSRVVLFGGMNAAGIVAGETWEWDGADWTQALPATSPPPRYAPGMVYDSGRGRTLLFGGFSPTAFLNDTWEWDGVNWTELHPPTSPPGRGELGMTYDSARGVTVVFGGYTIIYASDTWEFDGRTWQQRFPSTSPPGRARCAIAFDPVRRKTVLFGGAQGNPPYFFGDTWEWDGTGWTQFFPTPSPCDRHSNVLVAVPGRGLTILVGGLERCASTGFDGTWTWDGIRWREVARQVRPFVRPSAAGAFDEARSVVVRFGGFDGLGRSTAETWTLGRASALSSVVPAIGSEAGGDLVHLRGSRLEGVRNADVTIGGTNATVVSATSEEVRVRTPRGTGVVDVQLRGSTLASAFTYAPADLAARFGNVNERIGDRENVLLVNGNVGGLRREQPLGVRERIDLFMNTPSSRTDARFVLYAWIGAPGVTSLTTLPRGLGAMVFPVPATGGSPQPRAIFNNLGFRRTLGSPTFPSIPAPSVVYSVNHGAPRAVDLAFQGIIQDDGSTIPEGYSVTNAVILHVR
ncbi:MAG: IPT/TIG domain-containing protein [Planctomycetes bacterium]|nr:IPT/TIG domain-containing protein [Planctomycetota bacterium]MBI3843518.1 IPT/TIG domain-containing protein [Planctomycetota bacterium]